MKPAPAQVLQTLGARMKPAPAQVLQTISYGGQVAVTALGPRERVVAGTCHYC